MSRLSRFSKQLLLFFVILFSSIMFFSIMKLPIFHWYNSSVIGSVIMFALLFLFKELRVYLKQSFTLEPMKKVSTYVYLAGSFLLLFLTTVVLYNQPLSATFDLLTSPSRKYYLATDVQIVLFIIGTGIMAPIWEEFVFRGIFLRKMCEKFHPAIGYIIVVMVFTLFHVNDWYVNFVKDTFMIFLAACLFSFLYLKTRSVFPSILLHSVWNVFFLFYWNYI